MPLSNPLGFSPGQLRFVRVRTALFALRLGILVAVLVLFVAYGVIQV
jgi:hypothetical protein